jgi:hypothetical protein
VPRFIATLFTLTIVTMAAPLAAQTAGGQITGVVSDSLTGQPVGAAEVSGRCVTLS